MGTDPLTVQPVDVSSSEPQRVGVGSADGAAGELSVSAPSVGETPVGAGRRRVVNALNVIAFVVLAVLVWPVPLGGSSGYTVVSGESMEPTYHTGDLVITRKADPVPGDVIVYRVPDGDPGAGNHVVHRVVGGDGVRGYETLGDNKPRIDSWRPKTGDVVGVVRYEVPQGGRVLKLVFSIYGFALLGAVILVWVLWPDTEHEDKDEEKDESATLVT